MHGHSEEGTDAHDPKIVKTEALFFLGVNNLGGAELSMSVLARNLHARGIPTEFAAYGARRDLMFTHAGAVPVNDLPVVRTWSSILPLYRLLREKRPAFLVTALHHTNIAGIIAALLARTGTRVIATEHGSAYKEFVAYKSRHASLMMPAIRMLYPLAGAIVTVSKGLAEELHTFLPREHPVHVIYNPVIPAQPREALPPAHAWLEPGEAKVVLGIGRLSQEKDFASLIRAFAQAAQLQPLRLIILGEGPERGALEALATELGVSDRVLMPGFVEQINAWLPYANLFVSASQHEGFGNAIVEAMAHRVPVVAVDCPFGPAEILENGRFGRLVGLQDMNALIHAIEDALLDAGDLNAAQVRSSHFTVTRCVDDYLALMRHIERPAVASDDELLPASPV